MTRKRTASMVMAALLLGLLAGPAAADKVKDKDGIASDGVKDAGTLFGTAKVGKFRDHCLNDGTSTVSGPGLGTFTQATKNAYFALAAWGAVDSLFKAPGQEGNIRLCGRLTKQHSAVNGGMGAACEASKGWDGKGTIVFPGKPTLWLSDFGWKASVSAFVATADVVQGDEWYAKDKFATGDVRDQLVAEIQASGLIGCLTKVDGWPKDGGATDLVITASYQILQGQKIDRNSGPDCKSGLANGCLNDPKKSGASG